MPRPPDPRGRDPVPVSKRATENFRGKNLILLWTNQKPGTFWRAGGLYVIEWALSRDLNPGFRLVQNKIHNFPPKLMQSSPNQNTRILREAGWSSGPVWMSPENFATTGARTPDRPAVPAVDSVMNTWIPSRTEISWSICCWVHKQKYVPWSHSKVCS